MPSYFAKNYSRLRYPIESAASPGFRPVQIAAAHAVSGHLFSRSEPAIVVMPTGSGKTCVMLLAAFLLRSERILVLTPSRMVRDQIASAFRSLSLFRTLGAVPNGMKSPRVAVLKKRLATSVEWEKLREKNVFVSTVQSVSPLLKGTSAPPGDFFDLVICDEAHHTPAPSWRALLDGLPKARHLLFTGTPFRRDSRALRGRLIFEYPLSRARADGVFGQLCYRPVEPSVGESPDVALAKAAEAQMDADREAGLRHYLMVRTSTKKRAAELEKTYGENTKLRLRTIFGTHGPKRVSTALDDLKAGRLDGMICVDMLGEGFDLPNLKIAALHSPHRSLSVTLQFIGRFARTTAPEAGEATFFAVPEEMEHEASQLYVRGAEWNELVEDASRKRIEAERDAREVLDTFVPTPTNGAKVINDEEIDIGAIAPYFHVKVLQAPKGVDFSRPFPLPVSGEPCLVRRSDDHNALVCVTRDVSQCRWSRDERLADVRFDLFVLFFEEKSKLLFVCSSVREVAVYDAIVDSVACGETHRLAAEELNRVLRGVGRATFHSVGMRNRSGLGSAESYRMITGRAADKVIQKNDGRFYDRGHCFGSGDEAGNQITIGFSSGSKIWSNKRGVLPELFAWCRALAGKLHDSSNVSTNSNLDHLPLAKRLKALPPGIVAADWNADLYRRDSARLFLSGKRGKADESFPLVGFSLSVQSCAPDEVRFAIEGYSKRIDCSFKLTRSEWFEVDRVGASTRFGDADSGASCSLVQMLREHPPEFFTTSLERIDGDLISGAPKNPDDVFDVRNIEAVDWRQEGVNPLLEKPPAKNGKSLFEWLQTRLVGSPASVVYNDDGPGEAADFIAVGTRDSGRTVVSMYHCKAAKNYPVPGQRVEDLYEVVGQAVKCLRLARADAMRAHICRRLKDTKEGQKRMVKGTEGDLLRLLDGGKVVEFEVCVVQPGVGKTPGRDLSNLLASANGFLGGALVGSLRVIGSV